MAEISLLGVQKPSESFLTPAVQHRALTCPRKGWHIFISATTTSLVLIVRTFLSSSYGFDVIGTISCVYILKRTSRSL